MSILLLFVHHLYSFAWRMSTIFPSHHTAIPEWGNRESILTLTCSRPKTQVNMDSR
ncbi:hypothetical protein ACTXPD_12995 [Vreelandella alkaliphila]|uniref:hypothetical protein n=1 Tax=Halomonadaceae TaxID=28256 RepID=UPI001865C1F2|nr:MULTISPECIES: hypothetical protein [unclassified Halomonas]